jgi:succinoglycan biosynthesis transport protein ExoP
MSPFDIRMADGPNRLDDELPGPDGAPAPAIDAARVISTLRRQRWVVAGWLAVAGLLGILVLATTPRSYQAWATVMLTGDGATSIEDVSELGAAILPEIDIENAQQVLSSQRLAERVSGALRLWEDERLLTERPSGLSILMGRVRDSVRAVLDLVRPAATPSAGAAGADGDALDPAEIEALNRADGAAAVLDRLRVVRVGRSSAIALGYEAQSPDLAADVVNALVDAYSEDVLEANQLVNEEASTWLAQRLAQLGAETREAAIAVERFRAENGLVESGDGLVTTDSVRQLNQEYSSALAAEATARATVAAYDAFLAQGQSALLDPASRGLLPSDDARVAELRQAFDALVARRESVVSTFGENHPEAQRLTAEIDSASRQLFDEVVQAAAGARNEFDVATNRLAALRDTLGGAVETDALAGEARVELRALEQRAETVSALYESVLVQSERAAQQRTLPVSDLRVLSYAEVPLSPSSPSTTRTLGLALVLGMMGAMAHAALREWNDRNLRTGADVTARLGQRFLGYLPSLRELDRGARARPQGPGRAAGPTMRPPAGPATRAGGGPEAGTSPSGRLPLPAVQHPTSHFAETLRNVRLASELAWGGREGGRVLAVTSMRPGEGKSTVALNLAAVLASGGQRTLLVDADPRKVSLSRRLGLVGRPGLAAVSLGGVALEDALQRVEGTNVEALGCEPAGPGVSPFDLLSAPATHELLARARRRFRCVVLDLAPLGPVVDARLLLPATDQVLMVATWGRTPRPEMAYALAHEPQVRERLLGIVLNQVDLQALARYAPPDAQAGYDAYYGVS